MCTAQWDCIAYTREHNRNYSDSEKHNTSGSATIARSTTPIQGVSGLLLLRRWGQSSHPRRLKVLARVPHQEEGLYQSEDWQIAEKGCPYWAGLVGPSTALCPMEPSELQVWEDIGQLVFWGTQEVHTSDWLWNRVYDHMKRGPRPRYLASRCPQGTWHHHTMGGGGGKVMPTDGAAPMPARERLTCFPPDGTSLANLEHSWCAQPFPGQADAAKSTRWECIWCFKEERQQLCDQVQQLPPAGEGMLPNGWRAATCSGCCMGTGPGCDHRA